MLSCKHSKFNLPPRVTYLNCAYMAPLLSSVEKAGIRGVRGKRNPAKILAEDFFTTSERLRGEFARLINSQDVKRVVILPSVSYGMANVAKNLTIRAGQHIVVASEQFPSNYYVWQSVCGETNAEVKIISPPDTLLDRGKQWNERILQGINSDTRAVAIANVHWADGTRFDLEAIRKRTKEVDALLIIDGTQSVGALPFDVQKIQPDALVCAGYKWLLGPYSIGLAYYGSYFDEGKPVEDNWINRLDSENFSKLVNYQNAFQPGSLRYEVGEHSNFILVPMMLKAIQQLNRWGPENIQEYCKNITAEALAELQAKGFWIEDEPYRASHMFGLRMPKGKDVERAKGLFQKKNIYVSFRGDAIRVSPNVYNNTEDMRRLVKALSV
jgi:selenocysteine lyase/cysteine desulfurase